MAELLGESVKNLTATDGETVTLYAKWSEIKSSDNDEGDSHHDSSSVNTVNTDLLYSYYEKSAYSTMAVKEMQGNLAMLAFGMGMPSGYNAAFTLSLLVNGKADYSLKTGRYVLSIPMQYRKAGRSFALIGLTRTGKPVFFTDTDTSDSTITTILNLDGYAFMLVYSDAGEPWGRG